MQKQIFDEVEQAFKDKINSYAATVKQHMDPKKYDKDIICILEKLYNVLERTNVCCSDKEKEFLLDLSMKIEKVFDGPPYTFKDICFAVIYTYYGLNLIEDSYFNISILPRNRNNQIVVNHSNWNLSKEFNYWMNTYADNISVVYYLFLRLGAPSEYQPEFGPIIFEEAEEDLSAKLREFVMNNDLKRPIAHEDGVSPKKRGGTKKYNIIRRIKKSKRRMKKSKRTPRMRRRV